MACDNVESYEVVTADRRRRPRIGEENPDLFWGLRGGGGNFGVVTEFEFRLHPRSQDALVAGLPVRHATRRRRSAVGRPQRDGLPRSDVHRLGGRNHDGDPAMVGFVWSATWKRAGSSPPVSAGSGPAPADRSAR